MDKPVILTEDQLRERCAYWQKVLRLQDWDVKITVVPLDDRADVITTLQKRYAAIRLADPKYFRDAVPQDMEQALVHELLHLHLEPCGIPTSGAENDALEVAVHRISEALVNLDRKASGT